jgi:adenylate kinase family enzyme
MRVQINGTSGSGKTTLARQVAAALGLPHIELDAINWQPDWRGLNADDPALFEARVRAAIADEHWVCDGNYSEVRAIVAAHATDVVMLDYSGAVVMRRVLRRSFLRALLRKELWPGTGNREHFAKWIDPGHPIRWAWSTHARRRASYRAILADPPHADVRYHHLTHPRQTRALVEKLSLLQRSGG